MYMRIYSSFSNLFIPYFFSELAPMSFKLEITIYIQLNMLGPCRTVPSSRVEVCPAHWNPVCALLKSLCNQKAASSQSEVCVFVWGEETSNLLKEATCAPRGLKNKRIFCAKWYFPFQAILNKTSSVIHKPISRLDLSLLE